MDQIIALRRSIHQHAELAFQEYETQKKIKEVLLSFGIDESKIKACAGTGLVVDIEGNGDPVENECINTIALRADIDALPIPEDNPHLEYKTQTKCSHMCGHDGHTATLTAAA